MQVWFNALPDVAREEIADLFQKLSAVTDRLWTRPIFDPLDGEGGISEIRPREIRCDEAMSPYRIYGFSRTKNVNTPYFTERSRL